MSGHILKGDGHHIGLAIGAGSQNRRAVGGKAHGASALCSDRNAHLRRADPDRGEYPDQGAPVKRHSPFCGTAAFPLTQTPHPPVLLPVDAGFVFHLS